MCFSLSKLCHSFSICAGCDLHVYICFMCMCHSCFMLQCLLFRYGPCTNHLIKYLFKGVIFGVLKLYLSWNVTCIVAFLICRDQFRKILRPLASEPFVSIHKNLKKALHLGSQLICCTSLGSCSVPLN